MQQNFGRSKEQVQTELTQELAVSDFRLQGKQPPFYLVVKSSVVEDKKKISLRDLIETHRKPVGARMVSITLEARNS